MPAAARLARLGQQLVAPQQAPVISQAAAASGGTVQGGPGMVRSTLMPRRMIQMCY
jgi:hypothetical protein